ncbi:MAG: TIGR03986 family CRISPR-associated RAMP protein [Blastocatellia bacterium]
MTTEIVKGNLRYDPLKQKWFLGERKMSGGLMGQLSDALRRRLESKPNQATNIAVEYELSGQNQISNIREEGQAFSAPQACAPEDTLQEKGDFHNPYNFIPALPRDQRELGELGDHTPAGHGSYRAELWSGRITVTLTTASPLLMPDAANVEKRFDPEHPGDETKAHKVYQTRVVDGQPYLPPTSIKGMLRAAYEAVTNSRLSIFADHEERLAYRMPANDGLKMVPARIENGRVTLYAGTAKLGNDGRPIGSLMYAAWLRTYDATGRYTTNITNYQRKNGHLPQPGEAVEAWIEKVQHKQRKGDRNNPRFEPDFQYWQVVELAPAGKLGAKPNDTIGRSPQHQPIPGTMTKVSGFVCLTHKNIDRKHDERVFFQVGSHPQVAAMSGEAWAALKDEWQKLIEDYRVTEHKGLRWSSRHLDQAAFTEDELKLNDGTLCYARVEQAGAEWRVTGLFPVMISRRLHQDAPHALLQPALQPAQELGLLSPADRVFGWVNQKGSGAYRGQLRISQVECLDDKAILRFPAEVPLAILGQPKPQQVRFYAAPSQQGESWANVEPPVEDKGQVGYWKSKGNGLRGRKVYPHHAGAAQIAEYWQDPHLDRTQKPFPDGFYQEYRRPHQPELRKNQKNQDEAIAQGNEWKLTSAEQQDSQNRTIKDWIQSDKRFQFEIQLTNLSDVELGALLWLLALPPDAQGNAVYFHRLGGGKPLGFGSVALQVAWSQTNLHRGREWAAYYRDLAADLTSQESQVKECIEAFKRAVKKAYGGSNFEQTPFIAAFLRMARGFKRPIHYPRARHHQMRPVPPHPQGLSYEWFVANERTGRNGGDKLALPDLANDQGLPLLEAK